MPSLLGGTTSYIDEVFIQDSTSTTGGGKTALAFNTSGLTCYYKRSNGTASVAVSLATITTLGTFATGGFKEVDSSKMPGVYEFHPPNTALAAGATSVTFFFVGATGMAPMALKYEITAVDNQNATNYGMTGLGTAQTGDNYARLGAPAGASVSADVAAVKAVLPSGTTAVGAAGGLATCDSTNSVKVQTPWKKNTARAAFMFLMVDSSGNPKIGLGSGIVSTCNIDKAGFNATTNSPTEIANGWYTIDLAAADLNGSNIALRLTGTGAADRDILISPLP